MSFLHLRLTEAPLPVDSYHMRISDEAIVAIKEQQKHKKEEVAVRNGDGDVAQVQGGDVDAGPVRPLPANDDEDPRMINEDQALDQREAELEREWRAAKALRDERRRLERERIEEQMRPETDRLRIFADLNSSALADPAVGTVVTQKSLATSSSSESSASMLSTTESVRPSRSSHKCPLCVRTFCDLARLQSHIDNHH